MKCFAQNTKQITHSSHVSYLSISLPVTKVLILGIKLTFFFFIISETVWSSKAFSLAGLPQGVFLFISGFFTYTLSSSTG